MKKGIYFVLLCTISFLLVACTNENDTATAIEEMKREKFSVGALLPDYGLGDQSFNDLAVNGLVKAREDLDIIWSYRDQTTSNSLEEGIDELIAENHDVIIGVGYTVQELFEDRAAKHPDQRFVLIDTSSTVENIDGIVFKEFEGSYLAGAIAAMLTTSNTIGFVGGMEDEVIFRFRDGFIEGATFINPEITVLTEFANTYADADKGRAIAKEMIENNADILYAAAGYTGVGLLQQAQDSGVYAIGVDNDQYFYAEKAVVTSMLKKVDVAVYKYIEQLIENPKSKQQVLQFGIADNAIGLAPIRIVNNAAQLELQLEKIAVPTNE